MGMIQNDWLEPLKPEFKKPYYEKLYAKVKEEYSTNLIFPPADDIFNAFDFTPFWDRTPIMETDRRMDCAFP